MTEITPAGIRQLGIAIAGFSDTGRRAFRQEARRISAPAVRSVVAEMGRTRRGAAHIAGHVTFLGNNRPGVRIDGGLAPELVYGHDFGGGDRVTTYMTRRGMTTYVVTRHTTRQFGRKRFGDKSKVVYPAIGSAMPLIVDEWVRAAFAAVDAELARMP